jgi:hypothetical protein
VNLEVQMREEEEMVVVEVVRLLAEMKELRKDS